MFYEKEGNRLFFRLSVLAKFIKCMREIKIKIFYDKDEYQNLLKIMFPNITYGKKYKIVEKINILEKKEEVGKYSFVGKIF